ncbi:MAG: hypothetical protein M1826_006549 [Phylliscum demangeonii]|nr:MAG: hypothetical protein M1826_006549 [Phylliscum demangeonii]
MTATTVTSLPTADRSAHRPSQCPEVPQAPGHEHSATCGGAGNNKGGDVDGKGHEDDDRMIASEEAGLSLSASSFDHVNRLHAVDPLPLLASPSTTHPTPFPDPTVLFMETPSSTASLPLPG